MKSKYIKGLAAAAILGFAGVTSSAHAFTECQSSVKNIWAGDAGYVWIFLNSGVAAEIAPNDPNREAALSLATTAMVAGHQVILRFAADNVDCTVAVGRTDFLGMYFL
jgi:hypothetical protein